MLDTGPLRLSPSALRSYAECPYRYFNDYVIRLPDAERAPVQMFALGNAVHAALARFQRGGGHSRFGKPELVQFLLDTWPSHVYANPEVEARQLDRARVMVERFFDEPYPDPSYHDLGIERRLSWKVARQGILATGKLDRICETRDRTLLVVDYKTGLPPRDSDSSLASDFQSLFYRTLAAEHFPHFKDIVVAFHYLPMGETRTVRYEAEEFHEHWGRVSTLADEIQDSLRYQDGGLRSWEGFPMRPGPQCQSCPMRNHCTTLQAAIAPTLAYPTHEELLNEIANPTTEQGALRFFMEDQA